MCIRDRVEAGGLALSPGEGLAEVLRSGFDNYLSLLEAPEDAAIEVERYLGLQFAVSLPEAEAVELFPDGSISKIAL
eukprot:7774449-Alexandrium_andersonii.AAC.1